jgi:gliding motility-associated-like protein
VYHQAYFIFVILKATKTASVTFRCRKLKLNMNRLITVISLSLSSLTSLSQLLPPVSLCLGDDATVCQGQQVTINNCGGGGGSNPAAGLYLNAPANVNLSDDVYSGVVPIGFTFNFYNNNHTQLVIGSNGLLTFDLGKANGFCAWALGGAGTVPNPGFVDYRNATMGCYMDMNPGLGGQIQYQTIGTAPNRVFAAIWKEVPVFSCGGCSYFAILLYEGSNNIEYHIGNKMPCTGWNGGLAVQATENAAGNIGHFTPGRNNAQWSANQDGKRYTPTSPGNTAAYTVSTIPYLLVSSPGTNLQWQNTLGQSFPYNNGVLNVTQVPPGTTGYFLTGSACGASIGSVTQDTTWLTRVNSTVTATSTPDICSSGIGTVTATPGNGIAPFTFTWPSLAASGPSVTNVSAGTYQVAMIDGNGCPSQATVTVGDTPANFTGATTLVTCPGGTDGTATATMTPLLGNITYLWDDPAAQTTSTATGLAAGTYNCTVTSDIGCADVVTVNVTEIPGMIATIANQTDVTCYTGNDGMIEVNVIQGTPGYSYSWDNSISTSNIANDLFVGDHTLTITDQNDCIITISTTLAEPEPLQITLLTNDTQICPENTATLDVAGSGGSSPYTFTWYENGSIIGNGAQITVDPNVTNTQYCVVLSEQCGSPTVDSCMIVYFPTPILPILTPDKFESCIPGEFTFTNTSDNGIEIATMYVLFSEGTTALLNGTDPITVTFQDPTTYSVDMTVTSVYGCVYSNSHQNIVEVVPNPEADFTFSSNPATIFETSILMQDRSSFDVVQWEWSSPGSSPSYSYSENPTFMFPEGEVGEYPVTLTVTTENGCTDTVTYIMNIVPAIIFYAPNTFTPDDDEFNQSWEFYVSGIDIYDFELTIFNRWGETIWETKDASAKWDGTYNGERIQEGTYVWKSIVKTH